MEFAKNSRIAGLGGILLTSDVITNAYEDSTREYVVRRCFIEDSRPRTVAGNCTGRKALESCMGEGCSRYVLRRLAGEKRRSWTADFGARAVVGDDPVFAF